MRSWGMGGGRVIDSSAIDTTAPSRCGIPIPRAAARPRRGW